MSYVPQFKNDIFISYRHTSNDAHDRWIDTFCQELRARLLDLVGEVTIWRDEGKIRAGDQWRAEIMAALDTTAIFLAVISRTYFDSDVCCKEMDCFLGKAKSATEAMQKRIVPIFKQPLKPDQQLPLEIAACHNHKFFKEDPKRPPYFMEYSPGSTEGTSPQFWETLERLAQDLMDALEELKGYVCKMRVGTVFLARVAPELHDEREKLRSDLQQRGFLVVPEREYFWNSADLKERISDHLAAADLCVHLVCGASCETEVPARARLQLELAVGAMKKKGKPMPLVWIRSSDSPDCTAKELIDYIEEELSNEGVEYLEDTLEEFKTQIYAKLPSPPAAAAGSEVALIVEQGDVATTRPMKQYLVEKLAVDPKAIAFAGAEPADPAGLAKTLARCSKCIIYWGGQTEGWVDAVLSHPDVTPLAGRGRLCVYAAPPDTPEKEAFLTTKAQTVIATAGVNEEELRHFIAPKEGVS
ncbi:toll/interleukin-1 receptor domain-containing protein [Geomonas sp. RF6]|uniref:toll/interleukin-1 receptor domain-containing protein n=1 Tax=Geomonas sp. RF6 TaxID=2897342 RepID=UPI001E3ADEB3|nr:toll/interleukin-1 receptor domain-containing protein [Geomonas sp. RF6]UFS69000.1 toll/interleukin-1 receptor domain-containing protein [Geomonas sp. RF6]